MSAAFWDSSLVVPLCVAQKETVIAQQFQRQHQIVAWWGTSVEVHSAAARLQRSGYLSEEQHRLASAAGAVGFTILPNL